MSKMEDVIRELEEAAASPRQAVLRSMRETGKRAVGCFPIYTPEEIVYAAGMLPVGMWGGQARGRLADRYLQRFCCSVMRANTEQALRGSYDMLSAVILTTFCDTLKCVLENWKAALPQFKLIPMVYPQNRKSEEGKAFLREEFERVAGELEAVAGGRVTEAGLAEALEIYEDWRGLMREFTELAPLHPEAVGAVRRHRVIKSAYFMDKKAHAEKMRALNGALRAAPPEKGAPKRVILSGLLSEPEGVLEILAENGMTVAADDLAQESRQFRTPAPEGGPALERMAGRAALQDGCAFLYDETKSRGRRLIEEARRRGAVGVIYCQMKFCDPDEFDYPVIKRELEAAGVPLLHIETEQQMDSLGQLMTRVQSFAEMLE